MKIRLDQYLVQNGLVQSRERAKALIMAGVVFVNQQKVDKAGEMIKEDAVVEVRGHDIGYVSRGGLKLEKAMKCFPLTPNGKVCMDIGASTGGFTDCMLQNGAVKVYAVDVGYGQLAWKIRTDERVSVFERTNIKLADPGELGAPFDLIVCDVSFIGLAVLAPAFARLSRPASDGASASVFLGLVKPQFESRHDETDHGIVRDEAVRARTVEEVRCALEREGFEVTGTIESPIKGAEGNVEYLVRAVFQG